jgi:hypothetical protein
LLPLDALDTLRPRLTLNALEALLALNTLLALDTLWTHNLAGVNPI